MKRLLLVFLFLLPIIACYSQVWIPVTKSDVEYAKKQAQGNKQQQISKTRMWKFIVKDNAISGNKYLFSETSYDKNGLATKTEFFNNKKQTTSFTIYKYNSNQLPFEEITFSPDSTPICGVIYEYTQNKLLKKQTNYKGAEITDTYKIERSGDSIYVVEVDSLDRVISYGSITAISDAQNELTIRQAKEKNQNNNNYDILQEIFKKHIIGSACKKDFVYENSRLVKTSIFDSNDKEISSASFEYDKLGIINRIIERNEIEHTTNVYMINVIK